MIAVRPYEARDRESAVGLVAEFRVALSALHGRDKAAELPAAEEELQEYIDKAFPIFVATAPGGTSETSCIGYLVCRVDDDAVWAESLFVLPQFRRQGVAGELYRQAERLAQERGQETLYNWVHPNNDAIIAFLKKRGYDVLNLIEVRRRYAGEDATGVVRVGDHRYAYDGETETN